MTEQEIRRLVEEQGEHRAVYCVEDGQGERVPFCQFEELFEPIEE